MSRLKELEAQAIQTLKLYEPRNGEPYRLCYSGGKDSDCIRILAQLAGVKHECKHNLTTVDAPETVRYVRDTIGRENIEYPKISMWRLIIKYCFPPTRIMRYCCSELKERGGSGRVSITGVRKDESINRAKNQGKITIIGSPKTVEKTANGVGADYVVTPRGGIVLDQENDESKEVVERCYQRAKTNVNPIVEWTTDEVWEFLHHYGCESNPLYKCGEGRIGCVGCPMQGGNGQKVDFARYPKYRAAYVRAFDRMLERRKELGKRNGEAWQSGEDVMAWWVGDDPRQLTFDKYLNDEYADAIADWEWEVEHRL